jgi:hypothetical protein
MDRDNAAINLKNLTKKRYLTAKESANLAMRQGQRWQQKESFWINQNKDQVPELKMKEGEFWEKFQGKCTNFHTKFKHTIMCPKFHTKGQCHKRCKWAASYIAAKNIPKDVKTKYCPY